MENEQQEVSDTTSQKQSSEFITKIGFRYYPNPTSGPITIRLEEPIREIRLADIYGKLIVRYETGGNDILRIDISGYCSGIYYLVGEDDGESYSGKMILNR